MMSPDPIYRDERTVAVENAGYRWSYLIMSFGLLGLTGYRSFVLGQDTWDLLALILLSGSVNVSYQWSGRILYPRWIVRILVGFATAALVAAAWRAFGGTR